MARASANLAANLAPGEIRGVHVRIGQTIANGFQSRIEVAWSNALERGPGDVCCGDCSSNGSFSSGWASWLVSATAQKYHDTTGDFPGREVEVGYTKRRCQAREI